MRPDDLDDDIHISADIERHINWLQEHRELGFEHLYLHCVHRDQQRFIVDFGKRILPALSGA